MLPLWLALLSPPSICAPLCECMRGPSVIEAYRQNDVVLLGRVIDVRDTTTGPPLPKQFNSVTIRGPAVVATIEAIKWWKGPFDYSINVITGRGGGDCGVPFVVDGVYLIYAARASTGAKSDSVYRTTACDRSGPPKFVLREVLVLDSLARR